MLFDDEFYYNSFLASKYMIINNCIFELHNQNVIILNTNIYTLTITDYQTLMDIGIPHIKEINVESIDINLLEIKQFDLASYDNRNMITIIPVQSRPADLHYLDCFGSIYKIRGVKIDKISSYETITSLSTITKESKESKSLYMSNNKQITTLDNDEFTDNFYNFMSFYKNIPIVLLKLSLDDRGIINKNRQYKMGDYLIIDMFTELNSTKLKIIKIPYLFHYNYITRYDSHEFTELLIYFLANSCINTLTNIDMTHLHYMDDIEIIKKYVTKIYEPYKIPIKDCTVVKDSVKTNINNCVILYIDNDYHIEHMYNSLIKYFNRSNFLHIIMHNRNKNTNTTRPVGSGTIYLYLSALFNKAGIQMKFYYYNCEISNTIVPFLQLMKMFNISKIKYNTITFVNTIEEYSLRNTHINCLLTGNKSNNYNTSTVIMTDNSNIIYMYYLANLLGIDNLNKNQNMFMSRNYYNNIEQLKKSNDNTSRIVTNFTIKHSTVYKNKIWRLLDTSHINKLDLMCKSDLIYQRLPQAFVKLVCMLDV